MSISLEDAKEVASALFSPAPEVVHHRTSVNTVFVLSFEGSQDKILKTNDHPEYSGGLLNEQRVLPQLRGIGLAVSKVETTQDDLSGSRFPFSVMPREASESISNIWWRDPEEVGALYGDAGRWLAHLHRHDPSSVPDAIEPSEAQRLEIGERERINTDVLAAGLDLNDVAGLFDRFTELQERPRTALIHGDYSPGQVMASEEAIAYVVDWDYAQHGRPMRDLGLCLAYTKFYGEGLALAEEIARAYWEVRRWTASEAQECDLWELYTLLRVTSGQHLAGGLDLSARGMELIRDALQRLEHGSAPGTA